MQYILLIIAAILVAVNAQASSTGSGSLSSSSSSSSDVGVGEGDPSIGLYSYIDTANAKPYVVGIRNTSTNSNYCAGVLIAPKFVLTSNLCQPDYYYQDSAHKFIPDDQYASIGALARSDDAFHEIAREILRHH